MIESGTIIVGHDFHSTPGFRNGPGLCDACALPELEHSVGPRPTGFDLDQDLVNEYGLPYLSFADGMDPVDSIQWVQSDTLHANAWNPNRVHLAELRLLERSLLSTGWLQPLLVNPERLIIDGFHRWRLSQDSEGVRARWRGRVPVAVLDLDRAEAMLTTIRINRAKGTHVAVEMSAIVRELIAEHGYDRQQIADAIGGTVAEVDLLNQQDVFAAKGIAKWAYSQAWYPKDEV